MLDMYNHTSVLVNTAVKALNIKDHGIYIDGTFGCGGHSHLILSNLSSQGQLYAIDRDPIAVAAASNIRDPRFTIIHGVFSGLVNYISQRGLIGRINGILLDLGLSSPQIDNAERGFSFMQDGPLDMRMDPTCGITAKEWLLKSQVNEIARVLKEYGNERFAKRIARAIVKRNSTNKPITRTKDLVSVIKAAIPYQKNLHKHPATRCFQAIRIFINNELNELVKVLQGTLLTLAPGGRLVVISFHSLEDRIVKRFIRKCSSYLNVPKRIPLTVTEIECLDSTPSLRAIDKIKPTQQEVAINPRARSAILRIAEKRIQ
ncbi:MAG: 16S rRNA (cytosine(1402)-N(4))-methyltransferase RsmH [Candidatus Dasytiphilus stammeri]